MVPLGASSTEAASEHAFPENQVRATWTASAVEFLLGTVIDAGNAHRRQLGRYYVKRQIAILRISAEAHLACTLSHLVVVIHQRHNLISVPAMLPRVVQNPILKYREVVLRISKAADHALQLARDVVNSKCRVQTSLLDYLPC